MNPAISNRWGVNHNASNISITEQKHFMRNKIPQNVSLISLSDLIWWVNNIMHLAVGKQANKQTEFNR